MFIYCYCKIRDIVLSHIIKNHISRTPFLRVWENDNTENDQNKDPASEADLFFIELPYVSKGCLADLVLNLKNKPVVILTDHKANTDEKLPNNIVILPKTLSHKEFVEGLISLIDKIG